MCAIHKPFFIQTNQPSPKLQMCGVLPKSSGKTPHICLYFTDDLTNSYEPNEYPQQHVDVLSAHVKAQIR